MVALVSVARWFIGIAMVAFGLQHIVYGKAVTRALPDLPASLPGHSVWAYFTGLVLLASGVLLLRDKSARASALWLGTFILAAAVILGPPQLAAAPVMSGAWTSVGKALALTGAVFLVAESLPGASGSAGALEHVLPAARYLLAAFLILCGVQHFLFLQFVATLVPAWIPGHVFWTVFAGIALIAGGIGMLIPLTRQPAALLTSLMVFLWVLMLHIPRAAAAPHDANETTAVFEALAVSAAALLVAAVAPKKIRETQTISATIPRAAL